MTISFQGFMRAIGIAHFTLWAMGSIGFIDYHVCIAQPGQCAAQQDAYKAQGVGS